MGRCHTKTIQNELAGFQTADQLARELTWQAVAHTPEWGLKAV